jgi:hypothetical protein
MEEILSLIMVSFFALFPFLFLLASRRRMRERKRPGSAPGSEPGGVPKAGEAREPEQTKWQARENFDQPDSIVARIMRTQGIRQITGVLKPVPETAAEAVYAAPKLPERRAERDPGRKPERQWQKKAPEEPEPLRGRSRIEALPKLQQAVVWAEILGKPKGY